MSREEQQIVTFNRGKVSPLGVARVDVKRVAMSAATQTNWIPRVLGSMSIRPGMQYLGSTKSDMACRMVPFMYSTDDTAILEFTDSFLRIWKNDALITRATATSTVGDLSAWTNNDQAGGVSTWTGAYLQFVGNGTNAAIRDTAVTTASPGIQHALRIVVARGPVYLRVGTSQGDDSYINEVLLKTGTHSLTFTPTGTYYVRLFSRQIPLVWVTSCQIEAAGVLSLPSPYLAGALSLIRVDQSADVVFIACQGYQQRMIERRNNDSWSIVNYAPVDGPFEVVNSTPTTLTSSATTGNITLTASNALFKSTHVGALFQLISEGQTTTKVIVAQNTFTDPIEVQGTGTDRTITINLTASPTFTGTTTVTLQRSIGAVGTWADVAGQSWTAVTVTSYTDGLNNQIVYYRLGIKTGNYTAADGVSCTLSIGTGSTVGVVRVTDFTSSTSVGAEVLAPLGGTNSTDLWREGSWSDKKGWPTAVAIHEARMWWSGNSMLWGSISDTYDSYDTEVTGDSGVISRSIGSGPVNHINWMESNQRLLLGSDGTEFSARASSLDEPLTPTAFVIKPASNQGSASVEPVKIDNRCIFVQRGGSRVYELSFDTRWYDYAAKDLTTIVPEIGSPNIIRMAMQRQPDTRIHCVRSDGTVALNVQDKNEDVMAWVEIETDGDIEDVVVLPAPAGVLEDYVYYVVKRTINGATVRYLEKWAQSTDCIGGTVSKLGDAFIQITQASSTNVTGLSHLEGKSVTVWADGADVGTNSAYTQIYTVTGGQIFLAAAATQLVIGLPYTATFNSMKIGSPNQEISQVLNHYKNINHIGFVMANTHQQGLRYGTDIDNVDNLPLIEMGKPEGAGPTLYTTYDEQQMEFPGGWDTDARVYLMAIAPRPCTLLGLTFNMEMA